MLEKEIEKKLVKAVTAAGGWCVKLTSPGNAGLPDRVLLFSGARVAFAELKAPGKKPRPLQEVQMRRLRDFGFPVYVIDSESKIRECVKEVSGYVGT